MKPPKLQSGDKVTIISPSGSVANRKDLVEEACRNFEQATGLQTVLAPHALGHHYYSSGTSEERLHDFHWALNNPDIKAIIFSVGGNTAIDLVEGLDYELIKQNPKIIAGISDATTLLDAITAKTGLVTFLGIEFMDYAKESMAYETEAIKKAWFEGDIGTIQPNANWKDFDNLSTSYTGWQCIREGKAQGKIIGGNYGCFVQLRATGYWPNITNGIFVMETYKKNKKDIHQALAQLKLWGVLDQINGLIIGYCLGSDAPTVSGNDRSMNDVVLEVTDGYDFPILWMGEIGHNVENIMLPIGAVGEINTSQLTFTISESVSV
jgi:muramoyltetrapeptide carboxypeptidase